MTGKTYADAAVKLPPAPWLSDLRRKLTLAIAIEVEVTAQVAVCLAAKLTTSEIKQALGCTDLDIRMAKQRLADVAGQWYAEGQDMGEQG